MGKQGNMSRMVMKFALELGLEAVGRRPRVEGWGLDIVGELYYLLSRRNGIDLDSIGSTA